MSESTYRPVALPLIALCLLVSVVARAETLALTDASIADINRAMDQGRITSEELVQRFLHRIESYDDAGPAINAVLQVNPDALAEARELDAERRRSGPRSPLHGIPVALKDNIDTADLPTTAGSFMLAGAVPPDDAFLVQRLRAAGAVIIAKLNMSEFASGGPLSSMDGQIYNPHDTSRSPAGSSGGTGAAIAAAYAMVGFGTDTGGSVRMPSSANGIVGLKPTLGLVSRDGIVPLALSFDTAGPMARNVYDVAATLGVVAGVDEADEATAGSAEHAYKTYTQFLDAQSLQGARLGIARDFMGADGEVDWVMEAAFQAMRDAGAELVDVSLPQWLLDARGEFYRTVRYREFRAQIAEYLQTTGPDYPKTLRALIEAAMALPSPDRAQGYTPNPSRWQLMLKEDEGGELTDREYLAVRDHALPLLRGVIEGIMDENALDAIVYPTQPQRPGRIDPDPTPGSAPGSGGSPVTLANLTGFPDLIVPAGFTARGLPVTVSFFGRPFSEPQLLGLGYAFEQGTRARRLPKLTPPLAGEILELE
ncbi:MAG: amidase family protein [Chromatocurvus sp.]